jgi:hypothetical protein
MVMAGAQLFSPTDFNKAHSTRLRAWKPSKTDPALGETGAGCFIEQVLVTQWGAAGSCPIYSEFNTFLTDNATGISVRLRVSRSRLNLV